MDDDNENEADECQQPWYIICLYKNGRNQEWQGDDLDQIPTWITRFAPSWNLNGIGGSFLHRFHCYHHCQHGLHNFHLYHTATRYCHQPFASISIFTTISSISITITAFPACVKDLALRPPKPAGVVNWEIVSERRLNIKIIIEHHGSSLIIINIIVIVTDLKNTFSTFLMHLFALLTRVTIVPPATTTWSPDSCKWNLCSTKVIFFLRFFYCCFTCKSTMLASSTTSAPPEDQIIKGKQQKYFHCFVLYL